MTTYIEIVKTRRKCTVNIKDFSTQNSGKQQSKEKFKNDKLRVENGISNDNFNDFEKIQETKEFKKVEENYGDFVKDFVDKYGQLSEQDLLAEMLKLVATKKAEGNFDAEKIKQMAGAISPLLDQEQKQKMENLLKYLD